MSKFTEKHKKGLIGTVVFHVALMLLMLFTSLTTTPPTFPEPEGLVVNYGMDETGMGEEEPAPTNDPMPVASAETAQSTPDDASEAVETSTPEDVASTTPNPVLTQDVEDAPSIAERERKRKETEQKRVAEAEQQAKILEQKRKDDAEREQKAEEQRKIAEAQKQKDAAAQKIKDRAAKAFGNANGSTSTSQGVTGGPGNQGQPDGQAGINNYKGGGTGNGIDWSLGGREALDLPHPSKGIQVSGKVIVEIVVDNNGAVIEARPGIKGSTTTDGRLYDAAQRAAMKAKFNVSASAPPHQKGSITYIFELQ